MKYPIATLTLLVAALVSCSSGTGLTVKNAGFEGSVENPVDWMISQHAGVKAYEMSIDDKKFTEGKHSFRMKRIAEQSYGMIGQFIAAPGSEGKLLKLSAMLSSEQVGPRGWMLVVNFQENSDRIISQARSKALTGDVAWERVVLEKEVPAGTDRLYIGVMLLDSGTGWADDVKVQLKEK